MNQGKEKAGITALPNKRAHKQPLIKKLKEGFAVISQLHDELENDTAHGRSINPAGEWILDNYYIICEAVMQAAEISEISEKSTKKLPRCRENNLSDLPRIYCAAVNAAAESGWLLSDDLAAYINKHTPDEGWLMREIYLFATFFGMALLAKLSDICVEIIKTQQEWRRAESADLSDDGRQEKLIRQIDSMDKLSPAFLEHLLSRLRSSYLATDCILTAVGKKLPAGITVEALIHQEHENEARRQAELSNIFASLKNISGYDQRGFFERTSTVQQQLLNDEIYAQMDDENMQCYRSIIEKESELSGRSEQEVVRSLLALTKEYQNGQQRSKNKNKELLRDDRKAHVGYYLLHAEGRKRLCQRLGYQYKAPHRLLPVFYIGLQILIALAMAVTAGFLTAYLSNIAFALIFAFCFFIIGWEMGARIANALACRCAHDRFLPRLSLTKGLPPKYATAVVIPCLLANSKRTKELVHQLEVHYLSARLENTYYVLLGDFSDTETPIKNDLQEQLIIKTGEEEVIALNKKYGEHFLFLARRRTWSEKDKLWRGWERKRGALVEFNNWLRGERGNFIIAPHKYWSNIKYVLTLDADTQLGLDNARKLIGTIAHPLNAPVLDKEKRRVKEGYALIQPRIDVDMVSGGRNIFSLAFAGEGGIDAYSGAGYDPYQDIWGEAIYTGKCIYDVDVFRKLLGDFIPENRVLSHDLLEGSILRAGLAKDVRLLDGYPRSLIAWVLRQHRWVRGDWQLLPYLLPFVNNSEDKKQRNPLNPLSKWKIADNLRRSLLYPAYWLVILLSLLLPRGSVWVLTAVLLTAFLPFLRHLAIGRNQRRRFGANYSHLSPLIQQFIIFLSLPYLGFMMLDAAARAVFRLLFSKKNMLQWVPAAEQEQALKSGFASFILRMLPALIISATAAVLGFYAGNYFAAAAVSLLFSAGLWFVYNTGLDSKKEPCHTLSQTAKEQLLDTARRVWDFYDNYTNAEENFLPPDNVQIQPPNGIAHRTSPTNIGFYLTGLVIAEKLLFIDKQQLTERASRTLDTLDKLSKWHGHFYNWYDTRNLEILRPHFISTVDSGNLAICLLVLSEHLKSAAELYPSAEALLKLAARAEETALAMDFGKLYDEKRKLFSVGYHEDQEKLSNSYYDLLASEARLAVYFAVAGGQVSQEAWRQLSRPLTSYDGYLGLLSWSGTMFEYLMPHLFLTGAPGGLLDESVKFAVHVQRKHAKNNKPWGVSESGFYQYDLNLNYQYKALGIPRLALDRKSDTEHVITPYAGFLALPIEPHRAWENIRRLKDGEAWGQYGFYEAVDYTKRREGIVKSFMAHHQGMILAAIANVLTEGLPQILSNNALIRAGNSLLQERMAPKNVIIKKESVPLIENKQQAQAPPRPVVSYGMEQSGKTHVLSNNGYSIFLTAGGEGESSAGKLSINRHRLTGYPRGIFIAVSTGGMREFISPTLYPQLGEPDKYRVDFALDRAIYQAEYPEIRTQLTVTALSEDMGELRRLIIRNTSDSEKTLEITAWFEPLLNSKISDELHPVFSNLSIETSFYRPANALLCRRRRRKQDDTEHWLAFGMKTNEQATLGSTEFESDRNRFYGRNNSGEFPAGLWNPQCIAGGEGAVLDPVMALRRRLVVPPRGRIQCDFFIVVGESKSAVKVLADKYNIDNAVNRAAELSLINSKVEMSYLQMSKEEILDAWELGQLILTGHGKQSKYITDEKIKQNQLGQEALWSEGISGDRALVILHIDQEEQARGFIRLLRICEYWRVKGRSFDLLVLCHEESGYHQPLLSLLRHHAASSPGNNVFIRHIDAISASLQNLFSLVATAEFCGEESIAEQLAVLKKSGAGLSRSALPEMLNTSMNTNAQEGCEGGEFFNGYGTFSSDGKEYHICLKHGASTPAPWINMLTNEHFGTLVSESGLGYSWYKNSRENKISASYNDPLEPECGEVLYLSDTESELILGPLRLPARDQGAYIIRHGFGYTVYEHECDGMAQTLTVHADADEPVKICRLRVENKSGRKRRLSAVYKFVPVLGVLPDSPAIVCEQRNNIITVTNSYNSGYRGQIIFLSSSLPNTETGSQPLYKAEFLLDNNQTTEIIFCLGAEENMERVTELTNKFCNVNHAADSLVKTQEQWLALVGKIKIKTHQPSVDVLFNGWLMYQNIAFRLWGRSGFYQCGGAYGFRDQLQDMLALVYTEPQPARKQILLHASRQFREGDVLHWWHEEKPVRGVRTRISDDMLWLPYVTADYIAVTGDAGILDEEVGFADAPVLAQGEHERYSTVTETGQASLYNHCLAAINRAARFGAHGLPLIGGGDWNDGMNSVGIKGKGESIWMGWFMIVVLEKFLPYIREKKPEEYSRLQSIIPALVEALEENGWDGAWYRRAYTDDGVAIGSSEAEECRIDAISQSWAVMSGHADPKRAETAIESAKKYLWQRNARLFMLLTPPFEHCKIEPGYIKSYVAGIRENGGQYTHGVLWMIPALTRLGQNDEAWQLAYDLSPVNHSRTATECSHYRLEPYLIAADVYAGAHMGRGGWSGYTGSASWYYKVILEDLLGCKKCGNIITFSPHLPAGVEKYELEYNFGNSRYIFNVYATARERTIELTDNGKQHIIEIK